LAAIPQKGMVYSELIFSFSAVGEQYKPVNEYQKKFWKRVLGILISIGIIVLIAVFTWLYY
jgi:hypothetical protein